MHRVYLKLSNYIAIRLKESLAHSIALAAERQQLSVGTRNSHKRLALQPRRYSRRNQLRLRFGCKSWDVPLLVSLPIEITHEVLFRLLLGADFFIDLFDHVV